VPERHFRRITEAMRLRSGRLWRDRGDGTVYWSEGRQRWIADLERIFREASGKTKTEARTSSRS